MAQVLLERSLLEDEDQVVPRVCHEMLFAKDGSGQSLLDRQRHYLSRWKLDREARHLVTYLASYTDLSLAVVPERNSTPCHQHHHRDKRARLHATVVPLNPNLNVFQRNIANAFLDKWDQSFRRAGTTADDDEDLHAMLLPDDLKYAIMAYLSTADVMKM